MQFSSKGIRVFHKLQIKIKSPAADFFRECSPNEGTAYNYNTFSGNALSMKKLLYTREPKTRGKMRARTRKSLSVADGLRLC